MDFQNTYRTLTEVYVIFLLAFLVALVIAKEYLRFNYETMSDQDTRN